MAQGLIVTVGGILGSIFSQGLRDISAVAKTKDWEARDYNHGQGGRAGEEARGWAGPVVVMWHSAGAKDADQFADAFGGTIDLGVSVDAWLPFDTVPANYKRVISIKASDGGLYHMTGGNVVERHVIPDTSHTTVDDSAVLGKLVLAELDAISGGTTSPPTPTKPKSEPIALPGVELPELDIPAELAALISISRAARDPARETIGRTAFYEAFFSTVRPMFGGALSQAQVDGMKVVLASFDTIIRPKGYDDKRGDELLAFMLGNFFNESGKRMVPLRETGRPTDAQAYAALEAWWKSGKARSAGVTRRYWQRDAQTGQSYYGRGWQITHKAGYSESSRLWKKWFGFTPDFVSQPDYMLIPIVSAVSAFIGAAEGVFGNGKTIDEYRRADGAIDWPATRAMVNGDRFLTRYDLDNDGNRENMGEEIAGAIEVFLEAIAAGQAAQNAAEESAPFDPPPETTPPETTPPTSPDATMDALRKLPSDALHEAAQQAAELIVKSMVVLQERGNTDTVPTSTTPPSTTSATGADTTIKEFNMGKYSKLIGGLLGLVFAGAIGQGYLPADVAPVADEVVNHVTSGSLPGMQEILSLVGAAFGIYFAPKNAD